MAKLTDGDVQFLLEPNIGVVATLRRDGSAHLTAVWVDSDGDHVVFNTAEGRVKPRNLRRDPSASKFAGSASQVARNLITRAQSSTSTSSRRSTPAVTNTAFPKASSV
jgi:hypothetical protein